MKELLFIFAMVPLLVTGAASDEQSLDRLSEMFLGFLAIADVRTENVLLDDDMADANDKDNDKATRRTNRNRRRNDERRRDNNPRGRRPVQPSSRRISSRTRTRTTSDDDDALT